MKAMILAAGRGERLRPLTDSVPKPLIRVAGMPLIEWHIKRLRAAGITELVVNAAWLKDQLIAFLGDGSRWGVNIQLIAEPPGALDTGGGVTNALASLGRAPFWVVNADIYTDFAFPPVRLAAADLAHLVLVSGHARDFALAGGRVANSGVSQYTFSGIALYRPELFAGCEPGVFSSIPLLRRAVDAGRVAGEVHAGLWHDSGTPARLRRLRRETGDSN